MPKDPIEKVEIVEPPIGELTKQKSGFKRSCLSGCGMMFLFITLGIVGFKIYIGSGPKNLSAVPAPYTGDVPIYDKDSIERITFITGRYKSRGMNVAAFFPKIILSPLLTSNDSEAALSNQGSLQKTWELITTPVGDNRDTVQVEWRNTTAEPRFMANFYKAELRKKNFVIENESIRNDKAEFSFRRTDGSSGTLRLEAYPDEHAGTDYGILTINFAGPTSTAR